MEIYDIQADYDLSGLGSTWDGYTPKVIGGTVWIEAGRLTVNVAAWATSFDDAVSTLRDIVAAWQSDGTVIPRPATLIGQRVRLSAAGPERFMSASDMAAFCGRSRSQISRLLADRRSFPAPIEGGDGSVRLWPEGPAKAWLAEWLASKGETPRAVAGPAGDA